MDNNKTSTSYEVYGANVQTYIIIAKSPMAFTCPSEATGINIRVTGNYQDISQKNFEVLLQTIGLRAMPVAMGNPRAVKDVAEHGALYIGGEGFVWNFSVEHPDVFKNYGPYGTIGNTGHLVDEIDNLMLPSGEVVKTKGGDINMEIIFYENILDKI